MELTFSPEMQSFLDEVQPVIIGTVRRNGTVQMNPLWYERRGDEIWLNATVSRRWSARLEPGSDVTLLFISPSDMWRWAQVQGRVIEKTQEGGEEHIDRLSRRYLGRDYTDHRSADPRLVVRVQPVRVVGTIDQTKAAA
jgi:PPOX class probable F420-dependent enzyme